MTREGPGFPIVLRLDGQKVIVIGSDPRRIDSLKQAGAQVQAMEGLPNAGDLADVRLVFVCAGAQIDPLGLAGVRAWVWVEDDVAHSDFTMPAVAAFGPAQIAVSTGGASPALARRLRELLEQSLGEKFARFVAELGQKRPGWSRQERIDAVRDFALALEVKYPQWFR